MKDHLSAAKTAIAEGRWSNAVTLLEDVVAHDRGNAEAFRCLISIYVGAEDWGKASAHIRNWIDGAAAAPVERLQAYCWLADVSSRYDGAMFRAEYEAIGEYLDALVACESSAAARALLPYVSTLVVHADDVGRGGQWLHKGYGKGVGVGARAAISPVKEVRDWCLEAEATYNELEPPQVIVARNGTHTWRYQTEAYSIAWIPQGEVLCGWDFPVAPSGEVLAPRSKVELVRAFWFTHAYSTKHSKVLHPWPDDVKYVHEDVLMLAGAAEFHAGHWIVEFLPRLRALKEAALRGVKIAVPKELPAKQREALAFFGVESKDMLECDLGRRYRFRHLVDVRPGEPFYPNVPTTHFMAAAFRVEPANGSDRQRRIFLVRSHPTRRIINMEEVRSLLDSYGFAYLDLAVTSMPQQRISLAGAEIVVSTHGSDLLSVLSMHPGTDMIELRYTAGEPEITSCTDPMFSMLNVNYHHVVCDRASDPGRRRLKKDSDFVVDCPQLEGVLKIIQDRKASGEKYHAPLDITVAPAGDR